MFLSAASPHLPLSSRPSAARSGTHSFPEPCEGTLRSGHNHPMRQTGRRAGPESALTRVRGDTCGESPVRITVSLAGFASLNRCRPGQAQRAPGPGWHRPAGFSRCPNSALRLTGPGSPLRCVRDDNGEVGVIGMVSARTIYPLRNPRREISLILRKRAALSRRMGGRFRTVWPILRDGPPGPPQDGGLEAERGVPVTRARLAVPAKHFARRDRGSSGLPGFPAASPHLQLSSQPSAARAETHSFPALCEGTLRSGHNHPMRQTGRRVGPGSALTLVRGDSRRKRRRGLR